MKEDVLEQLVEDWFISQPGWFVKHNIRYRPNASHPDYNAKRDSVHSDIDLLTISGNQQDTTIDRVSAITCKSWQGGFNAKGSTIEIKVLTLDELIDDYQHRIV